MALYLIRHASAGRRSDSSDDFSRPLDAKGHEQAKAIAKRLSKSDLSRVLASPALRCQQTVGALARRCDLDVEVVDWLAEGNSGLTVRKRLAKLSDQNVALCSHGDVIPEVIRALEAHGMAVDGERGWKKGAVWTIHMANGSAARAEYTPLN